MINSLLSAARQSTFILVFFGKQPAYLLKKDAQHSTTGGWTVLKPMLCVCFSSTYSKESVQLEWNEGFCRFGGTGPVYVGVAASERCVCICHSWMPPLQPDDCFDSSAIAPVDSQGSPPLVKAIQLVLFRAKLPFHSN